MERGGLCEWNIHYAFLSSLLLYRRWQGEVWMRAWFAECSSGGQLLHSPVSVRAL